MIEVKTKLRKWGNSFGVVIPQKAVQSENVKEGDEITLLLSKNKPNLTKLFGKHTFKKPIEHVMKDIDRDLY